MQVQEEKVAARKPGRELTNSARTSWQLDFGDSSLQSMRKLISLVKAPVYDVLLWPPEQINTGKHMYAGFVCITLSCDKCLSQWSFKFKLYES